MYNDSTSIVTKNDDPLFSISLILFNTDVLSWIKEGRCNTYDLMWKSTYLDAGSVTDSLPLINGLPGGLIKPLCILCVRSASFYPRQHVRSKQDQRDWSIISFKRHPTLSDKLVKSYLPPVHTKTWLDTRRGNHQCENCSYCGNMNKTNSFLDIKTGQEYTTQCFINCNTTYVVYRLECPCGYFCRYTIGWPYTNIS